jgi:hypothetical protein
MSAIDDVAARFAKACELMESGRDIQAQQAFMDLLAIAPEHAGALNNLGTLLYRTGYSTAARTAYREAVQRHPSDPTGRVNLGNLLLETGESAEARRQFEAALAVTPDHAEAHRGLSYCLDEAGDESGARRHRDLAFSGRAITQLPWRGKGRPISVLQLVAARGGNIPTRFLLDDRTFATTVAVADYCDPSQPLPQHDLLFNAIGDADLAGDALQAAAALARMSPAPVINPPERVAVTGRAEIARRLGGIANVRTPHFEILPRIILEGSTGPVALTSRGMAFPLLLRALGFHTGRHFVRVERPNDLAAAVATLPGRAIAAIEYLDARGRDGGFRKYRVMMIDGHIYPLHLAVSQDWKVHYFTASMADRPDHRAEEAIFLTDMESVIGPNGTRVLVAVREALGLDYGGIDFGLGPNGEILIFEANATMVINPPEPDTRWDYRREPVQRVLDAARTMLVGRAGVTLFPPPAKLS